MFLDDIEHEDKKRENPSQDRSWICLLAVFGFTTSIQWLLLIHFYKWSVKSQIVYPLN